MSLRRKTIVNPQSSKDYFIEYQREYYNMPILKTQPPIIENILPDH